MDLSPTKWPVLHLTEDRLYHFLKKSDKKLILWEFFQQVFNFHITNCPFFMCFIIYLLLLKLFYKVFVSYIIYNVPGLPGRPFPNAAEYNCQDVTAVMQNF